MSVGKGQAKAEVDGKGQVKAEADGASRPSDLGFKLFGRTIPVPSDGDSKTDSQGTKQRGMRPIASATESFAISSIQDAGEEGPHSGDETLQSEDESNVVCIPDELRSSSGSNDGCDEEKCNPGSITGSENSRMGGHGEAETKAEGNETEDEKKQEAEGLSTQEKVLKKPDKLVPCPRCDSLDTKFCYYNNYNVNQPRHFCKNCQRYWTAGGSLRNVPVGAGRRKNKHSALHQRPILTDGMAVRSDSSDVAQQQLSCSMSPSGGLNRHLKLAPSTSRLHLLPLDVCSLAALDSPSSSTILNFGQESGLCESMATTLDLHKRGALQRQGMVHGTDFSSADAEVCSPGQIDSQDAKPWHDQKLQVQNGISSATGPSLETDTSVKWRPVDKSECGSSVTCQTLSQQQVGIAEPIANSTSFCKPPANTDATLGLANSGPFTYLGGPCQYSYNISWNAAAAAAMAVAPSSSAMVTEGIADPALFSTLVPAHAPANSSPWNGLPGSPWPGFPLPLMQSPIWGSAGWGGIMPWGPVAAAAAAAPVNPGLPSPTLGKHPRERPQLEDGTKGSLWIPKTLRIDDPGEAARSSIWATLGLGNRTESITSGGSFKAFQPKTQSKHTQEFPVQARHTNPAAMTRSITFQESG